MWNLEMGEVKEDPGLALEKFAVTERKKKKKLMFAVSPKTVSLRDLLETRYGEVWDSISQLLAAVVCLLSPCTVTADFSLKVLANSMGNKDASGGKRFC